MSLKAPLLSALLFAASGFTVSNAQQVYSEKIESKFLHLPNYDVSKYAPKDLSVMYTSTDINFGAAVEKKHTGNCMDSKGKSKKGSDTYYYEIHIEYPESYLLVKDNRGELVYAKQTSEKEKHLLAFGEGECIYSDKQKLKDAYEQKKAEFENEKNKKLLEEQLRATEELAAEQLKMRYLNATVEIYSDRNTTTLEDAKNKAINAFKSIKAEGLSEKNSQMLAEVILIWEDALKSENTAEEIKLALHKNLAVSYMYLYKIEEARLHTNEILNQQKRVSPDKSTAWNNFSRSLNIAGSAALQNADLINSPAQLNAMVEQHQNDVITVIKEVDAKLQEAKSTTHQFEQRMEQALRKTEGN